MGTPLGPKYIPGTYMDPLGLQVWQRQDTTWNGPGSQCISVLGLRV